MEGALPIILIILRIIGVLVCSNKAGELNRSKGGQGFFGFVSPIIAMIWIHCMKPVMKWEENTNIQKKNKKRLPVKMYKLYCWFWLTWEIPIRLSWQVIIY